MIHQGWQKFEQRFARKLTAEQLVVGERWTGVYDAWQNAYRGPKTLVHRDFRLDNVLFRQGDRHRPAAVVDWAIIGYAAPALDPALFLGTSFSDMPSQEDLAKLQEHYHGSLIRAGVDDYSFDALIKDYAWASFWALNLAIGSMLFDNDEAAEVMLFNLYVRQVGIILENGYLNALPEG